MITEEKLAAAQLAQIFGSTLLRIDEQTTQQNSAGPAVKMDPKQFLIKTPQAASVNQPAKDKVFMEALQREAEMAYPTNEQLSPTPIRECVMPTAQAPQIEQSPIQQHTIQPISDPNQMEFSFPPPGSPAFELFQKINKNLERIALAIENVDYTKKSKKISSLE